MVCTLKNDIIKQANAQKKTQLLRVSQGIDLDSYPVLKEYKLLNKNGLKAIISSATKAAFLQKEVNSSINHITKEQSENTVPGPHFTPSVYLPQRNKSKGKL